MAAIYLRHPEHGAKVASTDMEAAHDRANGWEDFDPVPAIPAFLLAPGKPLPEDFPAREALIAAGYLTIESLNDKTSEELQEIKGIGPTLALRVLDAL